MVIYQQRWCFISLGKACKKHYFVAKFSSLFLSHLYLSITVCLVKIIYENLSTSEAKQNEKIGIYLVLLREEILLSNSWDALQCWVNVI